MVGSFNEKTKERFEDDLVLLDLLIKSSISNGCDGFYEHLDRNRKESHLNQTFIFRSLNDILYRQSNHGSQCKCLI